MIRNVFPRKLPAVVAAAVFAAAVGAPASAPEASASERGCNPSYDHCQTLYNYYDSSTKSNMVGHATRDCDGVYTLEWGYETQYVTIGYVFCPY